MHSRTHRRATILPAEPTIARTRHRPQYGCGALVLGQEPSHPGGRAIVAGFDGTPLGEAAVAEAAFAAGSSGCVFVVYAYRTPPSFLGWPFADRRVSNARLVGRRALDDLWPKRDELPTAELIPELIAGPPADAISRVAAARHADAIVVGAGRPGGRRIWRRRVADELQLRTDIQVIVIPPNSTHACSESESQAGAEVVMPDVSTWW